jgi:hypothetical protein
LILCKTLATAYKRAFKSAFFGIGSKISAVSQGRCTVSVPSEMRLVQGDFGQNVNRISPNPSVILVIRSPKLGDKNFLPFRCG